MTHQLPQLQMKEATYVDLTENGTLNLVSTDVQVNVRHKALPNASYEISCRNCLFLLYIFEGIDDLRLQIS